MIIKWAYEKSNGQNGFWGEKEVDHCFELGQLKCTELKMRRTGKTFLDICMEARTEQSIEM